MAFARLLDEKQTQENRIILKAGIVYAIMNWHERIVADPDVLAGKPVIRGTRVAVEFVLDLLANGWSEAEIIRNYPRLNPEDIQACNGYPRKGARRLIDFGIYSPDC